MTRNVATLLAVSLLTVGAPGWAEGEETMKLEQTGSRTIVVIGASYAGGWSPGRPLAGHEIVAKGVSGEESSDVLARFEADAIAVKPDAIIIWGFINDIFRTDRSALTGRLKRTRRDLLSMVESARKAGIVPILATEVTIRGKDRWTEVAAGLIGRIMGKEGYQDYINRHVLDTNEWLRATTQREGILLLDFESVLADSNGIRRKEFARPDGSHISPVGYEALTQYADERLTAFFTNR